MRRPIRVIAEVINIASSYNGNYILTRCDNKKIEFKLPVDCMLVQEGVEEYE